MNFLHKIQALRCAALCKLGANKLNLLFGTKGYYRNNDSVRESALPRKAAAKSAQTQYKHSLVFYRSVSHKAYV